MRASTDELQLVTAWDTYQVDFTHTYEREGATFVSTLDHFYMTKDILQTVQDAGVIHDPDNSSDHEPIYCVIESFSVSVKTKKSATFRPKPSWRLASEEEKDLYKYKLDDNLSSIMVPTQITECTDPHCKNEEHMEAIDWFSTEVLGAVQRAGEAALPFPKAGCSKKGMKATPGFEVKVKPFKEDAYFWHAIWKSAGRPLNNQLHTIMKRTRNIYHREFKKCQKSEKLIKKSRLLDAGLNGEGDLFQEVKKMRKTRPVHADKIDGVSENIPDHFKDIYSDLYNSVEDGPDVVKISEEVNENISAESIHDVNRLTKEEVKKAAAALKPGKGDPVFSFSSDCLKVNSDILSEFIALMLKSFLIHNYIPQFMLLSTLVPIIKDKLGSINISKNYRSVCITSLILKQLDWIMISLFGEALGFHDLQFAYQSGVSANMCSWGVIETVSYFLRNGSEVFGCSMDKSKAFDMCKFSIVFRKLFNKISHIFLRIIIFMYVNQFSNVRWDSEVSSSFTISNGVGQGKILAGFVYCFYCFQFFNILQNSGYGCHVKNVYAGVFGYSDDDILLAPSLSALKHMIFLAEQYFTKHGLSFSTDPDPRKSKTKCIAWLKEKRTLPNLVLCGNQLPWVDKVMHLGITLTNEKNILASDMSVKKARYISKNIELNQEFYFAAPATKLKINDVYNSSWFGSVLYDLYSTEAVKLESCYNRSIKIMLDLPYQTHRGLIEPITGRKHQRTCFIKRFMVMIHQIRASKKPILKRLLSEIELDVSSTTGSNLRNIMLETSKSSVSEIELSDINSLMYFELGEEDEWRVEMLNYLLEERLEHHLDREEEEWLQFLCID